MQPNSLETSLMQDFLKKQKLRFHANARAEKTNTLLTKKRQYFMEFPQNFLDFDSIFKGFSHALQTHSLEEIVNFVKPLNNYLYDCTSQEICEVFRRFQGKLFEILAILAENQDNFALVYEFSMFFVNLSALLPEKSQIFEFFDEIAEKLFEIFKETRFLDLKENILIFFGNLALKEPTIAKNISCSEILQEIREVLNENLLDLSERFMKTLIWFLEICLEAAENPHFLFIEVRMIFKELAKKYAENPLFLLDFLKNLAETCPETQLFEFFREVAELLNELLYVFSWKTSNFLEKLEDFFAILTVFSSEIDIIPEFLQMNNLPSFFKGNLKLSPQTLEILLNLLCHGANTIKFLLQTVKTQLFSLVFDENLENFNENTAKKALQSLCICIICGDDEVCAHLLTPELLKRFLQELNHWEIDHVLIILKTLEKILFFCEEISKNLDDQSTVFESLLDLNVEKRLETLINHRSKPISLLAMHLLDKYF